MTFNDRYLFREKVTEDQLGVLANTIAHEMSHHWFGNLVTMKWWDDVWLNESFADFISHFCLHKIVPKCKIFKLESPYTAFFHRKGWAYTKDASRTTHPIRGEVPNTNVAEIVFDGITYSKGASTLKQLMNLMGEEAFGKGVGAYFHKY